MKKIVLYLILAFGLFGHLNATGAKTRSMVKKGQTIKKSSKSSGAKVQSHKKKPTVTKKKKKRTTIKKPITKVVPVVRTAQWEMIAQNKEQARIKDSVQKNKLVQLSTSNNEGYFASLFSNQKKAASFQTLNGTAAVFKSMSGWQDNKFYILTNELPVGTIVRITTSDFKSICAKVINALPEMGNAIQYRLNDAAAAILGVTNKTFQVSVTY